VIGGDAGISSVTLRDIGQFVELFGAAALGCGCGIARSNDRRNGRVVGLRREACGLDERLVVTVGCESLRQMTQHGADGPLGAVCCRSRVTCATPQPLRVRSLEVPVVDAHKNIVARSSAILQGPPMDAPLGTHRWYPRPSLPHINTTPETQNPRKSEGFE
jgi:hypothetical protein